MRLVDWSLLFVWQRSLSDFFNQVLCGRCFGRRCFFFAFFLLFLLAVIDRKGSRVLWTEWVISKVCIPENAIIVQFFSTERTHNHRLRVHAACCGLHMFLIFLVTETFIAAGALLDQVLVFAVFGHVPVNLHNFNREFAQRTGAQHRTVAKEVVEQFFTGRLKMLRRLLTELASTRDGSGRGTAGWFAWGM